MFFNLDSAMLNVLHNGTLAPAKYWKKLNDQWKFRLPLKRRSTRFLTWHTANTNWRVVEWWTGGWVSIRFRAMSSYSSDTMHRPSDPELSSLLVHLFHWPCWVSFSRPIIVWYRKKCNPRWEKGKVFLTCSQKLDNDHAGLYNKLCKVIHKSCH